VFNGAGADSIDVGDDPSPRPLSFQTAPNGFYIEPAGTMSLAANGLKIMLFSQANTYLDNGNLCPEGERHVDAGSLSVAAGTTIAGVY
jgi:hypothetical protein